MTCTDTHYQLPDFARGKIAGDANEKIIDHLDRCPACRQEVEQLRSLFVQLRELKPIAPPSATYWAMLLPRVHDVAQRRQAFALPEWIQRFALPVAAAMVVAIFGITVTPFHTGDSFGDLQASIQQFQPEELQDIAQQQTIAGIVEPLAHDEQTVTSESDTEVLQELLAVEGDHSAVTDIDHETLLQSLDEQSTDDLVLILERANMN